MNLLAEKMAAALSEIMRKHFVFPPQKAWDTLTDDEKKPLIICMEEFKSNLCFIDTLRDKTVIIHPDKTVLDVLDKVLGDCGPGPQELKGYIKMSDGYGPVYITMWNPKLNPDVKIPEE